MRGQRRRQNTPAGPGSTRLATGAAPGTHPGPQHPPTHLGQQRLALIHQARQVWAPLSRLLPLQLPHAVVLEQRARPPGVRVALAAGPRKQFADVLTPVVLQQLQLSSAQRRQAG